MHTHTHTASFFGGSVSTRHTAIPANKSSHKKYQSKNGEKKWNEKDFAFVVQSDFIGSLS